MAGVDEPEPVVVSSNRYLDIEPYTRRLFAEDPKTWTQVLPWEFPQQTAQTSQQMKLEEETFLREFFSEREIRVQGGASESGLGFRFLKQVWYCAALWNACHRLPAIVDWWLDRNTELVKDERMTEHFFKPDVQPGTFFDEAEIDLYGEKLLRWAIKQIQFRLRPELAAQNQEKSSTLAGPATSSSAADASKEATASDSQKTDTTATSSEKSVPTTKPHLDLSSPLPTPLSHQARSVSGDTNSSAGQDLPMRKQRHSFDTKSSNFNAGRPKPRQAQDQPELRHTLGHMPRFGSGTQLVAQPLAVSQKRMTSGGPAVFSPRNCMSPLPQAQVVSGGSAASPYPFANTPQHIFALPAAHLLTPSGGPLNSRMPGTYQPGSFQHGRYSQGATGSSGNDLNTQQNPFADRSNFRSEHAMDYTQHAFYTNDDKATSRQKQRQKSISSRGGGKSRGYGSLRGRGSRGSRNSFDQASGMIPTSNGFAAERSLYRPTGDDVPSPARRSSAYQRDRDLQGHDWRSYNENTAPRMFPATQDARYSGPQVPRGVQTQGNMIDSPALGMHRGSVASLYSTQDTNARKPHQHGPMPLCVAGCNRDTISDQCTTSTKLVVFGADVEADVQRELEGYGVAGIRWASRPKQWNLDSPTFSYLTFYHANMARQCLDRVRMGMVWPSGRKISAEVAKEHFDPQHFRRQTDQSAHSLPTAFVLEHRGVNAPASASVNNPVHAPQRIAPPATVPEESAEDSTSKGLDQSIPHLVKDPASGASTPTASGPSTPKRKKASKGSKRKKSEKVAEREEQSKTEVMGMVEQRKDSIWTGNNDYHGGSTVKVSTSPPDDASSHLVDKQPKSEVPAASAEVPNETENSAQQPATTEDGNDHGDIGASGDDRASLTSADPSIHAVAKAPGDGFKVISHPCQEQKNNMAQEELVPLGDHQIEDNLQADSVSLAQDQDAVFDSVQTLDEPDPANADVIAEDVPSHGMGSFQTVLDVGEELASDETKPNESKKAPVFEPSKSRKVSIALPPSEADTLAEVDSAGSGEAQSTMHRMRSNSSKTTASTLVRAPNTPVMPECSPEQRPNKTAKSKGPVQTESLSIFGKKKEKKQKKNKGSGSLRVKSRMDDRNAGGNELFLVSLGSPAAASPIVEGVVTLGVSQAHGVTSFTETPENSDSTQLAGTSASRRGTGFFSQIGDKIGDIFHRGNVTVEPAQDIVDNAVELKSSDAQMKLTDNPHVLADHSTSETQMNVPASERTDLTTEEPKADRAFLDQEVQNNEDADGEQEVAGLGISTESPVDKTKKNKKKKTKKAKKTSASGSENQIGEPQVETDARNSCGDGAASISNTLATSAILSAETSKQPLSYRKLPTRTDSHAEIGGEDVPAPASDIVSTNSPVTWIIWTRADDEQQKPQSTPSGRVIGQVDEEDEQLSPEVVAAREKLAKLRLAEEAARESKKSKSNGQ